MKLHTFPPSPNSVKVMAVINQIGLDVEVNVVDLTKGESLTDEFKAINPNGKIPVLEDGELILWESQAIMLYLAEKHDSSLFPKDFLKRTEMNRWLAWNLSHFGPALGGVIWENVAPKFFEGYETNQVKLDEALENLAKYAPILDAHLKDNAFVIGDEPSVADISMMAPMIHKEMANLPIEQYSNIMSWHNRILALPYFQAALPKQPATA